MWPFRAALELKLWNKSPNIGLWKTAPRSREHSGKKRYSGVINKRRKDQELVLSETHLAEGNQEIEKRLVDSGKIIVVIAVCLGSRKLQS